MQSAVRNTLGGSVCVGDTGVLGRNRQQDIPDALFAGTATIAHRQHSGKKCRDRRRRRADASLANTTPAGKSKGPSKQGAYGGADGRSKSEVSSAMMYQSHSPWGEVIHVEVIVNSPQMSPCGWRRSVSSRPKDENRNVFQSVNGLSFVGIM